MATFVQWFEQPYGAQQCRGTMIVGSKEALSQFASPSFLPQQGQAFWPKLLEKLKPGDKGDSASLWLPGENSHHLVVGALPTSCSRHNSPAQPHALTDWIRGSLPKEEYINLFVVLSHSEHALASVCAVARAFPTYSSKTGNNSETHVHVQLITTDGAAVQTPLLRSAAEAVRKAVHLVDMPTSELHTDAFVEQAKCVAEKHHLLCTIIAGQSLQEQGFGGLWNVGKIAKHLPALVVLAHEPKDATQSVVWVGKGIVYDTGGLSLKTKDTMPGMKVDMAGAAAVMTAFEAAVAAGFSQRLYAILCLAENAVGPDACRPDDIISMYSGLTVEVNNTDAEGRLVLADGVAYAAKHLHPDVIVDLATLTGAQLIATGHRHAAIVCNDDALEQKACEAGRRSGDLVHPLPYCPEFFKSEFKSQVADMKNSVKDRMNAQSSCAGQFIAEHLCDYKGPWLHVDIAGPSSAKERGTGFGVALLLTLFAEYLPS